jgi:ArsR family transcriptional regulator
MSETMRTATAARKPDLSWLTEYLRVLAEPNRLRIFDLLLGGTRCNCELGSELGMAPNLISHHLGVLRAAGLVDTTRDPQDARWVYYSVNLAALAELHAALDAFFDPARLVSRAPVCGPPLKRVEGAPLE